jgi:hypothetical protein
MSRCIVGAIAVWFATASAVIAEGPASAGRLCGRVVVSGLASAGTQADATAAAISWWSSRAGALGKGYEKWDMAEDKNVVCKSTAGRFTCTASARPCLSGDPEPDSEGKFNL